MLKVILLSQFQLEALPTKNQDYSSVNKLISQELANFNSGKLISLVAENSEMLEEIIPSVASLVYKLATCNTETTAAVLPHIDDVMACINITIGVYDMEILLYHGFQFGLQVYNNVLDLGSDILECRNESSNVFNTVECALNTLENSSSVFQDFWRRMAALVLDGELDIHGLTDNVTKCVGVNTTSVFKAFHLINSQC